MFIECIECHEDCNIPCHMGCGHVICYLCLNNLTTCTTCNANTGLMPNNLPGTNKYLWLYASNHAGMWWCYDYISNKLIEQIYQRVSDSSDEDDDNKIKFILGKKNKITQPQPDIPQFSVVNTTDNNSGLVVNFSDDNLADKSIHQMQPISSIIKIGNQYYDIDVNKMYQYNMIDKNKKRRIKRIIVPDIVSKGNSPGITSYLSDENVLGIAGELFDLK